jgi:hypothetical protein
VIRNGARLGTATMTGTGSTWVFNDTSPPSTAVSYTVQIESLAAPVVFNTPYAFTIDNIPPNQTFVSFTASNSSRPPLAPPDAPIVTGGSINDPRPTIQITLSGPLASGGAESLVISRGLNGATPAAIAPAPSLVLCPTQPAAPSVCYQFTETADLATIPAPTTPPDFTLPGTSAAAYSAVVRDLAGNVSAATGSLSFKFDYLPCSQTRAVTARATFHTNALWVPGNCSGCHTAAVSPAPVVTYVSVRAPPALTAYWCRSP